MPPVDAVQPPAAQPSDSGLPVAVISLPDILPGIGASGELVLLAVLLGILILLVVQWRSRQLRQRAQRLEHMVAERTRKVRQQARQLQKYNRELLRSNALLQDALEENSRVLGVAAHDLKNPIFGIRALAEVLLERDGLDEEVHRKISLMQSSANESLTLIDDLLATAAGTDDDKPTAERAIVDVADLAQWVVVGFKAQADRKDQVLDLNIPSRPCTVRAERRRLREAMNNLVSNALKYAPKGTTVAISVQYAPDEISFAVRDEGPGLTEEDKRHLFQPFQRLTPEPTGGESSSGLGLYIVKQVVDQHDGRVTVESTVGEGSTFKIWLPTADKPRASTIEDEEETVVDDDDVNVERLSSHSTQVNG
ncbi:sensor histidine kinase [Salisaeta longa]|uniref:sensor histidine kinase n=1 Tax=Salisaeta longa TaxID=503170 RepID=UPI0003B4B4AD|nr:HAMP domain-containing sensor histidine kinase [Salisaeta longa]